MAGLIDCHLQHLILTVSGAKPTIPVPASLTPDDAGWVAATDILRGELCYNTINKIWYTRTNADVIVEVCPERVGTKTISNGSNTVTFSVPFSAGMTYIVFVYIVNNDNNSIQFQQPNTLTVSGFKINFNGTSGTLWYNAKAL